jgi:threonine synthase
VDAARSSGGRFGSVSDEEILVAQRQLAAAEGIFVEPGSAASVAGLLKDAASSHAELAGRRVVVTVTGHGLKDIDTALSTFTDLVDTVVEADADAAAEAAGLS